MSGDRNALFCPKLFGEGIIELIIQGATLLNCGFGIPLKKFELWLVNLTMSAAVRNAVYSVSSCYICIHPAKPEEKLSLVLPAYNLSILRLRQDGHEFEANLGYVVSSELQKETQSL